jgi:[ribosomal protein S18]-alanine N-acetyltransferase
LPPGAHNETIDVMAAARLRMLSTFDIPAVEAIERLAHGAGWPSTNFHRELEENPVARYLALEVGGKTTGFAGLWIQLDEAHIVNVAVEPDQRGRGYGRLLVHGLVDLAMQYRMTIATLECRESNTVARSLYHRYGFYEVGARKRYYSDTGEDAVIMTTEELSSSAYQERFASLGRLLRERLPGATLSVTPADLGAPASRYMAQDR